MTTSMTTSHSSRPCRVCGITRAHEPEDVCEGWPTGEDLRCLADQDYLTLAAADEQAIYRAATKIENLESYIESLEATLARERAERDAAAPPAARAPVRAMCVGQVHGGINIDDDDGD